MTSTMTRPGLELGVRYYDNSKHSGSILGGEKGMLKEFGFKEQARTHRAVMVGDRADYSGLRFAFKKQSNSQNAQVQTSRRQTMSRLRKKESRLHFWKSLLSSMNLWTAFNRIFVRINPFATYHVRSRWSTR